MYIHDIPLSLREVKNIPLNGKQELSIVGEKNSHITQKDDIVHSNPKRKEENMRNLNPVVKGIISAAVVFVILFVIDYVAAMAKGVAFTPSWIMNIILSVLVFVLTIFGPDAEQRKKNRENLINKFRKK